MMIKNRIFGLREAKKHTSVHYNNHTVNRKKFFPIEEFSMSEFGFPSFIHSLIHRNDYQNGAR